MSESTVPLSNVLLALRAGKVAISAVDSTIHRYILSRGETLEEHTFTDPVGKRDLYYLSRKFEIAVHLFWHPEMIVPELPPDATKH